MLSPGMKSRRLCYLAGPAPPPKLMGGVVGAGLVSLGTSSFSLEEQPARAPSNANIMKQRNIETPIEGCGLKLSGIYRVEQVNMYDPATAT